MLIASFLPTARDMLCLGLTSTRFSTKVIPAPAGDDAAAAPPEMLSVADEAARQWIAGCSEQERGWVPRRELESWLSLMQEVALLRVPLLFGRAHAAVTLSEGGAVATKSVDDNNYRTVASKVVIRPAWDVEGGDDASDAEGDGRCIYDTDEGIRYPSPQHDGEGMRTAREQGDRVGMLLDLDQGSMTVWKNDVRLGVMQAEGVIGPLCWAVEMDDQGDSAVRIESGPAPASPTEEELAAAKVWQAAH